MSKYERMRHRAILEKLHEVRAKSLPRISKAMAEGKHWRWRTLTIGRTLRQPVHEQTNAAWDDDAWRTTHNREHMLAHRRLMICRCARVRPLGASQSYAECCYLNSCNPPT